MSSKNNSTTIKFLGGAGTVTGSKSLVEADGMRILVDCGLFQGLKNLRELNWKKLPVDPASIDILLLTHAHLDHCGYIPVLIKNGFKGEIHCTHPTKDLTEIILSDSGKIQEEDAERSNSHHYGKHKPAKPLYTQKEALACMTQFVTHEYSEWVFISPSIKFQFLNAGHILGSAMIELKIHEEHILFSGDVGRKEPMLLYPTKRIDRMDYVILESTYGDRIHRVQDAKEELLGIIEETYNNKGILMIPSFAVERTQELIYLIHQLKEEGRLPNIPVYLDSPMGVKSTLVFDKYPEWHNIPKIDFSFMYSSVKFVRSTDESRAVVADKKPKIVLAGSGMLEGGRMLHYILNHGKNPENTLLFVGFQAEGTRGRSIVQGTKQVKFFGEYHDVNCQIRSISSMSAHGDREELLDWLSKFKVPPKKIFLNHGEPHQANAFRVFIETKLGWNVHIPALFEKVELD